MPELAEVEYYRKQWSPCIGIRVAHVDLHRSNRVFRDEPVDQLGEELSGAIFEASETHGKQMLFHFGASHWLGVHLGMTGKLSLQASAYLIGKHDHLVLTMQNDTKLVFTDPRMFGRIRYTFSESPPEWWKALPPEILSDAFTYERMSGFLDRRARSTIKAVLLMQAVFPGIGNWMADEVLWRSRIHPATQSGKISKARRIELYNRLKEVSADALRVIGTDWSTPPDSWLFNHRWKPGGHCPKTGVPLERVEIGGRTTCWSPKWQTYGGS